MLPLAVHPDRPWILFEDGGTTMRATRPDGTGDHDLDAWERILAEYAELQRSLEGEMTVAAMLAAGAPDVRPQRLPDALDRLLDADEWWALIRPEERDAADVARTRLRSSMGAIHVAADDLGSGGVSASIQHDDLHGGNILVGPDGDRIFDWGDAAVAHPFGTLRGTFNSIAHHTGRDHDDPVFGRLLDVYLEAWTGVLPRGELGEVSALTLDFACIGKALAWERALFGLGPDEMGDFGDSVAGWLVDFAERLHGPIWAARLTR
jgi:hypothetical protein